MTDNNNRQEFLKEMVGSIFSLYSEFKAAAKFDSNERHDGRVRQLKGAKIAPFRPPGAIEEDAFLKACTRCDQCIKACPEHAIMKIVKAGSPLHLTPTINFRRSPCRLCPDIACSKSCSAQALVEVSIITDIKIGIARINKGLCYAWQGQKCDYCIDKCPLSGDAIIKDEALRPLINEARCIGCGVCEFICPVRVPAVMIYKY